MQLTNAGFQKALADWIDDTVSGSHTGWLYGLHLMLFTAPTTLSNNNVLADLTEATYDGYARQPLTWGTTAFIDSSTGLWSLAAGSVTFVATDAFNPNSVVGAALVQGAAGTNAVQTFSEASAATGGTFTLTVFGQTTAGIPWDATAAELATALGALSNVGAANVSAAGGPLPGTPVVVTYINTLGSQPVPLPTVNSAGLTGGTSPAVTAATTTAGVLGYQLYAFEVFEAPVPMALANQGFTYEPVIQLPMGALGTGVVD